MTKCMRPSFLNPLSADMSYLTLKLRHHFFLNYIHRQLKATMPVYPPSPCFFAARNRPIRPIVVLQESTSESSDFSSEPSSTKTFSNDSLQFRLSFS